MGLEGALFTLLDRESDSGLRKDIQETLSHMITSSVTSRKLGHWLKLCKDVLSATTGGSSHLARERVRTTMEWQWNLTMVRNELYSHSTSDCRAPAEASQEDEDTDAGRDDDSSAFKARSESGGSFTALRWATRRFAMECVCRIIAQCENADPAHFDMALAQERRLQESTGKNPTWTWFSLCLWTRLTSPVCPQTSWSSISVTWSAWRSWQLQITVTS